MVDIEISHDEFVEITRNYSLAAEKVNLVYVSDKDQGITRIRKGKGYCYYFKNAIIRKKDQLERIRKLVIPPAWKNVWICIYENGHLQATGYDSLNRKQYRYHALWNSLRNETKFHRMYEFGKRFQG